ncbi:hypothetical protein TNCV_4877981 [Trichonephila clavipes]|nr:hypothetical protein TNCV_4877981 [Trichonephila clavipes]
MVAHVSECEGGSYPAGREMGLPRNIAIQLGEQHCSDCPQKGQSLCFQPQELRDPAKSRKTAPHHAAATPELYKWHTANT